jgi:hypothetical protein
MTVQANYTIIKFIDRLIKYGYWLAITKKSVIPMKFITIYVELDIYLYSIPDYQDQNLTTTVFFFS